LTDELLDLLRRLVAFRSIAGRPNEPIASFVERWLREAGLEVRRVAAGSGERVNLYAAGGPAGDGPMLSAHMDVVDVAGQEWAADPFELRVKDGRAFGRGTADMKGFLACALLAARGAARAGRPLHLAISTDEEIGCAGARSLVPAVAAAGLRPSLVVVGEPTGMRRATAHKGKIAVRVHVAGKAVHSALAPQGENAVVAAARLIVGLDGDAASLAGERRDPRFSVPHSTISVGPIRGGAALNIVPDSCSFEVEMRTIPGDDPQRLLGLLNGPAEVEEVASYPALDGEGGDALDFGTEAGLWQQALGVPVEVRGPGHIADAHRAEESVELAQLDECMAFLATLTA
jgi:acetylornithine deacetylase